LFGVAVAVDVAVAVAAAVAVAVAVSVAVAVAVAVSVAVAVAVAVEVAVAVSVAVAVAVAVSVAVAVADGVGVSVGVGVGGPVMVMRPLSWSGTCVPRSMSTKKKLSGSGAQTKGLISPGVLLILSIRSSNNVPDPLSGVKSLEIADIRSVLIGPGPVKMLAETFQLPAVSPACSTVGFEKLTTVSSKVKSPWKAM
jgi:hypothetical protein